MRCESCNKFVSYDEPEIEIEESTIDNDVLRIQVRIILRCAECSSELKDAELDGDWELNEHHECAKSDTTVEGDVFEIEKDTEAEYTDRYQDKDSRGKPIKSMRYQKHYYGADLTTEIKCNRCGEVFTIDGNLEEQASAFQELQ